MTPLDRRLAARIAADGPMTVAEWMQTCLGDPDHGYYVTRDPFGARGDFITAPEISQMFGELVGLALAQAWLDQGAPDPVLVVELGPGRGTLMADALRAAAAVPGFDRAARLHLVETSPVLRAAQGRTLRRPVTHHDDLATVPEGPLLLVANEFFDALPVRQFQRAGAAWRERVIGLVDHAPRPGLGPPTRPEFLEPRHGDTTEGAIVEHCPAAVAVAAEIGRRVTGHGGLALIFDYGGWGSLGDTLQAVAAHGPADPFRDAGEVDLTAHVDFEALAHAARPAAATELTPQGVWLERLGITARARALARGLTGEALTSHVAAHRRLTHPDEMGTLFKTLAIYPQGAPLPPGFAA